MYFHLTTHSTYSLQEGLATPAELVQTAKAQGMPALGLTDHILLTGVVEFVQACQEADIQPILGLEIIADTRNLNLLAISQEGWANLCRLSSALALQEELEPSQIWGLMAKHANDLVALSDHHGKNAGKRLETLKDIFADRLYLTLQDPSIGLPVSRFARSMAYQWL